MILDTKQLLPTTLTRLCPRSVREARQPALPLQPLLGPALDLQPLWNPWTLLDLALDLPWTCARAP